MVSIMLYVGYFEFNYGLDIDEPKCGHFIYLVEAESFHASEKLLRRGLRELIKKHPDTLHGDIYLNGIVEIKNLPAYGKLFFFKERDGEPPFTQLGFTLLHDSKGIRWAEWYPKGKEPAEDAKGPIRQYPFMELPPPKKEPTTRRKKMSEKLEKGEKGKIIPFIRKR